MPKPFDAASKHLIETRPRDWLELAGLPVPSSAEDVSIIDADLSTVITTAADKLIRVANSPGCPGVYLAHVEFQSARDPAFDARMLQYNVLIRKRWNLPVWSAAFFLRPIVQGPGMTGRFAEQLDELASIHFSYHVVRVWELPTESILRGGLGILPLAPITAVEQEELSPVIAQVRQRLDAELPMQEGREFFLAMRVLMGLRYQEQLTEKLMQSIAEMTDSVEWQKIYRSGKAEGKAEAEAEAVRLSRLRSAILEQGEQRFGSVSSKIVQRLEAIKSVEVLNQILQRVQIAEDWAASLGDQ